MTRVLVTGGAGFIGSHLTELLLENGYQVTVFDNLSTGRYDWIPKGAGFLEGDITDLEGMRQAMIGRDGVFHLAAMSRVLPSLGGGPASCCFSQDQNIKGTVNVLVAAAEAKVRKVVYSASSTYYGNLPTPHYEELPAGCHTPYGLSKYVGELYCRQFARMYAVPTVSLRYFQVYGPRCPSKGEYAMVSSIFIEQALRGEQLTIHGDGSQRRDFVHVKDVAKANMLAFENDLITDGEVINVGRGESFSIQELADLISPHQTYTPPRAFDMKETLADTHKCRQLLRWTPEIGFVHGTQSLMRVMGMGLPGSDGTYGVNL